MYIVGRFPFNQNVWFEFLATSRSESNRAFSKISKKEENLASNTQIFENVSPEVFFPFNFAPRISRMFGWMVLISEIQHFPEFLESFPGNFCTIALVSKFSKVLGEYGKCPMWNGNLLCLSHSSAFLPLQHGCFVPRERLAVKGLFRASKPGFLKKKVALIQTRYLNL